MSYDISLKDPDTGETIELDEPHHEKGGTHVLGGTTEAWLNITYNYSGHFRRVLGDKGVRTIYGMTGKDSQQVLETAISMLGDDTDEDYWKPTEGNAKESLIGLLHLAVLAPNGVWAGD